MGKGTLTPQDPGRALTRLATSPFTFPALLFRQAQPARRSPWVLAKELSLLTPPQHAAEGLAALAVRNGKQGLMAPITAPQVIAAWALGAASRRDAIIATANRRNPFDAISNSPAALYLLVIYSTTSGRGSSAYVVAKKSKFGRRKATAPVF